MATDDRKMRTVQAVDRALLALETLSSKGSMNLADLSRTINVNKASLLRLLYTLVENGYLSFDDYTGRYALTMKTYELGIKAMQNVDRGAFINSILAELNRTTDLVAQFSIEDENDLLCIHSVGDTSIFYPSYVGIGSRTRLYTTSAGKAILAAYSNYQIINRWRDFDIVEHTEHTLVGLPVFLKDISKVRQRCYAVGREENFIGIFDISAVVMGSTNVPAGAISLIGTSLTKGEEKTLAPLVLASAHRISTLLGYVGGNASACWNRPHF